ncbi:ubiquitin protein ligase E3 component n-recognin 5 [Salpingoeca rosetta]|uniref:Ubiquitin protein ligase E3 component n-recognin 5 n=1 Tax=Salpingoeca rosetta (strain ATCC 50818 / BSB-021) TaxID=946362 RepID=F2TZL7_SALR5|nr:ubiquitin protein ligase E3 component n-recognin 5 [Salpingoeca rosetta]EGD79041.1 ubiquitin protein ligase E3 component n-recognin 5 [Salpingoeca rosetta]|eukprot:XP_004997997.1 ubiquitin protein ligase E3 component n-recognin 5 [Salpingoeca rosetta]
MWWDSGEAGSGHGVDDGVVEVGGHGGHGGHAERGLGRHRRTVAAMARARAGVSAVSEDTTPRAVMNVLEAKPRRGWEWVSRTRGGIPSLRRLSTSGVAIDDSKMPSSLTLVEPSKSFTAQAMARLFNRMVKEMVDVAGVGCRLLVLGAVPPPSDNDVARITPLEQAAEQEHETATTATTATMAAAAAAGEDEPEAKRAKKETPAASVSTAEASGHGDAAAASKTHNKAAAAELEQKREQRRSMQRALLRAAFEAVETQMERAWTWVRTGMDALEAQLVSGMLQSGWQQREQYIRGVLHTALLQQLQQEQDRHHGGRRGGAPAAADLFAHASRRDLERQVLSLLRGHSGEHAHTMPSLDVSQFPHLTFALDAIVYYLRARQQLLLDLGLTTPSRKDALPTFFLRSPSISADGGVQEPDLSKPGAQSLPLAERPERLHPQATRTSLFGRGRAGARHEASRATPRALSMGRRTRHQLAVLPLAGASSAQHNGDSSAEDTHPTKRAKVSSDTTCSGDFASLLDASSPVDRVSRPGYAMDVPLHEFAVSAVGERWKLSVNILSRLFGQTVLRRMLRSLRGKARGAGLRFFVKRERDNAILTTLTTVLRLAQRANAAAAAAADVGGGDGGDSTGRQHLRTTYAPMQPPIGTYRPRRSAGADLLARLGIAGDDAHDSSATSATRSSVRQDVVDQLLGSLYDNMDAPGDYDFGDTGQPMYYETPSYSSSSIPSILPPAVPPPPPPPPPQVAVSRRPPSAASASAMALRARRIQANAEERRRRRNANHGGASGDSGNRSSSTDAQSASNAAGPAAAAAAAAAGTGDRTNSSSHRTAATEAMLSRLERRLSRWANDPRVRGQHEPPSASTRAATATTPWVGAGGTRRLDTIPSEALTAPRSSLEAPPFAMPDQPDIAFEGELGEGVGVTRSFYTYLCMELTRAADLPRPNSTVARMLADAAFVQSLSAVTPTEMEAIRRRLIHDLETLERESSGGAAAKAGAEALLAVAIRCAGLADHTDNAYIADMARGVVERCSSRGGLLAQVRRTTLPSLLQTVGLVTPRSAGAGADGFDLSRLFWEPSKPGVVAPCPMRHPAKSNTYRLALLQTVGRLAGLCLLHEDLFPLKFTRPVIKFLLGQDVRWHDLAFHDTALYDSLRQLLLMRETDLAAIASLSLTFEAALPGPAPAAAAGAGTTKGSDAGATSSGDGARSTDGSKGVNEEAKQRTTVEQTPPPPQPQPRTVELKPGGADIDVTAENVLEYVELYARFVLVGCVEKELQAMRSGLLSVIPPGVLDQMSAEDAVLLLNGCSEVDISLLKTRTKFRNETGDAKRFATMQKWFWQIVEGMTSEQRHDLLYFWTSFATLPATSMGLMSDPQVVVRPPSDSLLPSANTCSSRLSIPAYSSKKIFRRKLLQAITTKAFGFV